jgi:hypothetical protein
MADTPAPPDHTGSVPNATLPTSPEPTEPNEPAEIEPAEIGPAAVSPEEISPASGSIWIRRATTAAMIALAIVIAVQIVRVATYDITSGPIVGDQASHVLQAISIADGANLSFDQADVESFEAIGWGLPRGLFYRTVADGYTFAKPYGYSLFLAPFVAAFGVSTGIAIANSVIVLALIGLCFAIMVRRFRPLVSLATSAVFVLGSSAYVFGYVVHPDLFLAMLSALFAYLGLRALDGGGIAVLAGLAAVTGFAVSEKPPILAAYGFVGLLLAWKRRNELSALIALAAGFVGGLAVSLVPYLYYSDFSSWNPYSGDRFYSGSGDLPFDLTPATSGGVPAATEKFFSLNYWIDVLGEEQREIAESAVYWAIGRHTGILPFMPLAALLLVVVCWRLPRHWNWGGAAFVAGIGAYSLAYVALFPFNYFGGGQTVGNRYLLQIVPLVLAVPVLVGLGTKQLWKIVGLSVVLSMLFLGPQLRDPERSYWLLSRTSIAQDLLPFEYDRTDDLVFACGTYDRNAIIEIGDPLCLKVAGITVTRVETPEP